MLRVAKRVRSSMLVANAWHARSDAASSLVVALGIVANLAGFHLADPLAALVLGWMNLCMGRRFFFRSFNDLMSSAVYEYTEERISCQRLYTHPPQATHASNNQQPAY